MHVRLILGFLADFTNVPVRSASRGGHATDDALEYHGCSSFLMPSSSTILLADPADIKRAE
jgi:hypothetical protein